MRMSKYKERKYDQILYVLENGGWGPEGLAYTM